MNKVIYRIRQWAYNTDMMWPADDLAIIPNTERTDLHQRPPFLPKMIIDIYRELLGKFK